jgi:hypothetical protein
MTGNKILIEMQFCIQQLIGYYYITSLVAIYFSEKVIFAQ